MRSVNGSAIEVYLPYLSRSQIESAKNHDLLTIVDERRECGRLLPLDVSNLLADAVVDANGVSVVRILRFSDEGDSFAVGDNSRIVLKESKLWHA